jgi:hypothetical protein
VIFSSSSIAVTIRFPLIFLPWPTTEPAKASKAKEERNDERDKGENLGRCHGLPLQLFANAAIPASLDGVAASTGSACHSGRVELSPVLKAMGIRPEVGVGAIRFSLGRYTTIEDVDAVVHRLTDLLATRSRSKARLVGFVEGTGRCSL